MIEHPPPGVIEGLVDIRRAARLPVIGQRREMLRSDWLLRRVMRLSHWPVPHRLAHVRLQLPLAGPVLGKGALLSRPFLVSMHLLLLRNMPPLPSPKNKSSFDSPTEIHFSPVPKLPSRKSCRPWVCFKFKNGLNISIFLS